MDAAASQGSIVARVPAPDLDSDGPVVRQDPSGTTRLYGLRCATCAATYALPVDSCMRCHGERLVEFAFSGRGRIYSHTRVHIHPTRSTPYRIGYVDLDEGLRILAPLDDRATIDARVELVATDGPDDMWAFQTIVGAAE